MQGSLGSCVKYNYLQMGILTYLQSFVPALLAINSNCAWQRGHEDGGVVFKVMGPVPGNRVQV